MDIESNLPLHKKRDFSMATHKFPPETTDVCSEHDIKLTRMSIDFEFQKGLGYIRIHGSMTLEVLLKF